MDIKRKKVAFTEEKNVRIVRSGDGLILEDLSFSSSDYIYLRLTPAKASELYHKLSEVRSGAAKEFEFSGVLFFFTEKEMTEEMTDHVVEWVMDYAKDAEKLISWLREHHSGEK